VDELLLTKDRKSTLKRKIEKQIDHSEDLHEVNDLNYFQNF
jgi:hypothetical protein